MHISSPPSPPSSLVEAERGVAHLGDSVQNTADHAASPTSPTATPSHNPLLTHAFLKALDPTATRFTFQLFRDPKHRKNDPNPRGLHLIHHCTASDACALAEKWNTLEHGYGLYVTINETDLGGRKRENITRVRAVFVDADENLPAIAERLKGLLPPSAIVQSSFGRAQFYWWVDDKFPLGEFERIQRALIAKLGTDPQVYDLPRVMRMTGTLHLKAEPQLVKLKPGSPARYSLDQIIEGLELASFIGASKQKRGSAPVFEIPDGKLCSRFSNLPPDNDLSARIELPPTDIRRLRSAYEILAAAGKLTERESWRDLLLFPLTEQAKLRPAEEAELKSLFDEISAIAGGETTQNEAQWHFSMGSHVSNPRTLRSVYSAARELGWDDPASRPNSTHSGAGASGAINPNNARRAEIAYLPGEIARAAEEAEAALIGGGAKLFRRGSNLVRPEVVETTGFKGRVTHQSLLRVATVPMLVRMLSQVAIFMRPIKGGEKPINPPEEVARGILVGQDSWNFPSVAGVVTSPTLRPDGSILAAEGYDPDTKLYVAKIPKLPPIPGPLTKDHAVRALSSLDSLLDEFPFEDDASRSVALSGILTVVCRGAFPVAPLHAVTAPTPGSGKSYLIDVIAAVANGNFAAVFTWSTSSEENEKRIDGALLDGSSIIAIDNISMDFGGDKICQTVERPLASVRRLGQSDRFEVENRATVFATGNNLILKGDITRRALVAVLDPRLDRPELRQFRRKPTEVVFQDRGRFIAAALTVVAAYIQAGQPNKLPPLASFEAWSDTIRSALVWLGRADPVETMKRIIDEDPDHQARVEFCRAWAALGGQARTVDQLIEAGDAKAPVSPATTPDSPALGSQYANQQFRDALLEVAGLRGIIDKERLAKWLRTNNGRVIEGHIIQKRNARKALWSIQKT
jgi:putative DNA primase/helicase